MWMGCVIFLFLFSEQAACGERGGDGAARLFFFFFRLATNAVNVINNKKNVRVMNERRTIAQKV